MAAGGWTKAMVLPGKLAPMWSGRVIDRASEMFGVDRDELIGKSRYRRVVEPRFLAARAMRQLGMSYPEVGQKLGGRDHSTAIAACRQADEIMRRHRHMRLAYEEIVNAGSPGFFPVEDEAA